MNELVGSSFRKRVRFFLDNAGYATPPGRMACAIAMAHAEVAGEARGLTFRWEFDECGDQPSKGCEMLCCACVTSDGEVIASLGGIEVIANGQRDPYGRVVEAELASEALDVLDDRDANEASKLAARATYAGAT